MIRILVKRFFTLPDSIRQNPRERSFRYDPDHKMKNTFGTSVTATVFGESHGPGLGIVLDGIAPGLDVDENYIRSKLSLRRPTGAISTSRREPDRFQIISGVYKGKTTGTPLCITIPNESVRSSDYDSELRIPRPGHADYTGHVKYHGFESQTGGGHFSGRVTAALVAGGAILMNALEKKGIQIGTHAARVAGINDAPFTDLETEVPLLNQKVFPLLDDEACKAMKAAILEAAADGDSVGGVLETAVIGMPAGVGEPWFDSVEGVFAHALYSIPAVKGVEFGDGFAFAELRGSQANDAFGIADGKVVTKTNHNGGVLGGITTGMPIIFRVAVKPTPSIFKEQDSVNLQTMTPAQLTLCGRHDPAIVHRARAVVDSVTAIVLADLLAVRYGTDWIAQ